MCKIKLFKNRLFKNTVILSSTMFLIEMIFKIIMNLNIISWTSFRIIISSFILGFVLSMIINFIKSDKVVKIVNSIIIFVISFYSVIQLGFYNFLGNYMSFNTSSQLGKVTEYIQDFIRSFDKVFYLIFIPFVMLILYYILIDKKWKVEPYKINFSKYFLNIIFIMTISVVYAFTLILNFMQGKYQIVSNEELFRYPSLQSVAVNQFGVSTYALLDIKSKFIGSESISYNETQDDVDDTDNLERNIDSTVWKSIAEEEDDETFSSLNNYFLSRSITDTNDYTGYFENKNIIVIMLESTNNIAFDEKNKEYYPNLYKLYSEGWSYTNNYSPRNNCSTGNNEFSALTSLYTINNICSANVYKENTYFESMFNLFKNKGYSVTSFHDYTDYYYYRKEIHPNLGSTYYGVEDLGIDYQEIYKEWPSDVDLIDKSYEIFSQSQPFMTYLTTVTTHQPYYVSSTYGDMYLDLFDDLDISLELKRYMSKLKVLDNAIGDLLDKLEADGILDDTVLVLFGDHYPYGITNDKLQVMFDYDISQNKETDRTPFIIYNSKESSKKSDQYTTYINILPTIANLFNLDYDPRYYMGEDLNSDDYTNIAVFADGSWQSEYAFYDAGSSNLSYISDDYTYSIDEINSINQNIYNKLTFSSLAIKNNYFEYLKEKMDHYGEDENDSDFKINDSSETSTSKGQS